jgi:hypothetical protein
MDVTDHQRVYLSGVDPDIVNPNKPNTEQKKAAAIVAAGTEAADDANRRALVYDNVLLTLDAAGLAMKAPGIPPPPSIPGDTEDIANRICDFSEKLFTGLYGVAGADDKGTATGGPVYFTTNPAAMAVSFDPVAFAMEHPGFAEEHRCIDNTSRFIANKLRSGKDVTRNEAIALIDEADDIVQDLADNRLIDGRSRDILQGDLAAARRAALADNPPLGPRIIVGAEQGAAAGDGALTTNDIMALIAEVLTRAARNANDMRQEESISSLANIQQSLDLGLKAAAKKEESAIHQKAAGDLQAWGQMFTGAFEAIGGALQFGASYAGASEAKAMVFGQGFKGIGSIGDSILKLYGNKEQYMATSCLATGDALQATGQQAGAIGNRAQNSAQDQGQILRSMLDALSAISNAATQTIKETASKMG